MRAQEIAVVRGGRPVRVGSHDQLIAKNGHYAPMFRTCSQQGETPIELAATMAGVKRG